MRYDHSPERGGVLGGGGAIWFVGLGVLNTALIEGRFNLLPQIVFKVSVCAALLEKPVSKSAN